MQLVTKTPRNRKRLYRKSIAPPSIHWREEEGGEAGGRGKELRSEAKAKETIGEERETKKTGIERRSVTKTLILSFYEPKRV